MKNKFFTVLLCIIVISALTSISAFAEISVDGNSIVGLNPRLAYEYAYVTLENFSNPEYIALPFESLTLDGLTPGLVALRTVGGSASYYLIDGENLPTEISAVDESGNVYISSPNTGWVAGYWSCSKAAISSKYYDGNHKLYPRSITVHQSFSTANVKNLTKEKLISNIQKESFRYAFDSDEIIRVEDFYSFAFTSGSRMGSTMMTPPEGEHFYTTVVLWTVTEDGEIQTSSYNSPVDFNADRNYTTHNIATVSAFPNAKGYVLGFEIFPYGVIPADTTFTFIDENNYHTAFLVGYLPTFYSTKRNDITTTLPFQYNGANSAYIDGKGMGMFLPNDHITIAELSTILAKLLNNGELPTQYVSSFEHIRPLEWYYKAIACMENLGAYNNIENNPFDPNKKLTRGEVAQMICNIAHISRGDGKVFIDLGEEHKYYDAITTLSAYGIIKGYADSSCCPDAPVSRAEVVTMINRFINLNCDETKTDMSSLESFIDIEGHWAKNEILVASNDNVKSKSFIASKSSLTENDTDIIIETDYIKINISKKLAKVTEFYNKVTQKNAFSETLSPWFSYIALESGLKVYPATAEIEDGRLAITYADGIKAYFIVEANKNYFTIELDCDLPIGVKYITFANFSTNEVFSTDENSFRLSAIPMATSATSAHYPGGEDRKTSITTYRATEKSFGSKVGIAFSPLKDHRTILKEITNAIDITVGVKSSHGGAFTYDKGNEDLFGDYVILSSGLNPGNAEETGKIAKTYSVNQIDIHQGAPRTFVQGGFSFTCARQDGDPDYISAALFKERIGDKITSQGIQLGLHTYSTLVDAAATEIMSNPTWQKQFEFVDQDFTLSASMGVSDTVLYTNQDTSTFSGYIGYNQGTNYYYNKSAYILVDEEIMMVKKVGENSLTVTRAQLGTVAGEHSENARINQYRSTYNQLQPIPGSDLFWHVADLTAKAYNEGGFEMIYLDGFESINSYTDKELRDFYYSEFIRRILEKCEKAPILEASTFPVGMWAARGRGGALDHPRRSYQKFIDGHRSYNAKFEKYFYTSTLGWFNYAPDYEENYKNTFIKTLFRDDVAFLGVNGIAYDMSSVIQPFSAGTFNSLNQLTDNVKYYNVYTRLRKAGYFSETVKEALKAGLKAGKEYKIVKTDDDKWAFREMYYTSNVIRDNADATFLTGSGTNPYNAQAPFIRIEQRYSISTTSSEKVILDLDENADVTSKTHTIPITNLSGTKALKVRVYGNNSSDGILLSLFATTDNTGEGRTDLLIPLNFSGWRDIILLDADNADYDGYTFDGVYTQNTDGTTFRANLDYSKIDTIKVTLSGSCEGVKMDNIKAVAISNASAINPSVKINDSTITFKTTLNSGEYIEYYPEDGKAYHNYYNGNSLMVKEISVNGSVVVPYGDFTFTYSATSASAATPLRARVTIGTEGAIIENEKGWKTPDVDIPEGWEKVQLH